MPQLTNDTLSSASHACLDYLLAALVDPDLRPLGSNPRLPAGGFECAAHNLLLLATPITERLFDAALLRLACASGRDVVLVRHGFHPETLDPVRLDVAMRSVAGPILIGDTSLFRHRDGSLHLVPAKPDLFIEVTGAGLDLSLVAPWVLWDERGEGLERAAADIVRACRLVRS